MQASIAQVRIVKSPNKHAKKCFRFYVAFNTLARPNSLNSVYASGDCLQEDLESLVLKAVNDLSAEDFVFVK